MPSTSVTSCRATAMQAVTFLAGATETALLWVAEGLAEAPPPPQLRTEIASQPAHERGPRAEASRPPGVMTGARISHLWRQTPASEVRQAHRWRQTCGIGA